MPDSMEIQFLLAAGHAGHQTGASPLHALPKPKLQQLRPVRHAWRIPGLVIATAHIPCKTLSSGARTRAVGLRCPVSVPLGCWQGAGARRNQTAICPMTAGILNGIFIAPTPAGAIVPLSIARLVPGRGIEGDRYFAGAGSFSRWPGTGRAISLMAAESVDAILSEHGIDLSAGRHRRNLVTHGVALADLIGHPFRIGSVLLRGERLCLPCQHLERLTQPGVFAALKYRGGLRADVLQAGVIQVGDAIEEVA